MADFAVAFTAGTELVEWTDPPAEDGSQPSRINPLAQRPHRRRLGSTGTEIEVTVTCRDADDELVTGPLDSALDGRTFLAWLAEYPPSEQRPSVLHTPGVTSVQRFTPRNPGHYTLIIRRRRGGGGGIFVHVDVVGR